MSADQPITWDSLTDDEREFFHNYRIMPAHRRPVIDRMIERLRNGMAIEEAKELAEQETAAADAKHKAEAATG